MKGRKLKSDLPQLQVSRWCTLMGLELAYERARDIIGSERAECLDVAKEVEQLRLAWRPNRVRVVLLAESHVWTSREEARSQVKRPDGVQTTGFARFVYCLGYGEPQLVKPTVTPNDGTPQFWRLFHDTIYGPNIHHARVLKTGEKDFQKRVKNKLDLNKKMQNAGVWLIDASITALYHQRANLAGSGYAKLLKVSWDLYIRDVLIKCEPSAILIVGKGVESAIGDDVGYQSRKYGIEVATINQPNARMSQEAINRDRQICFELCSRYRE